MKFELALLPCLSLPVSTHPRFTAVLTAALSFLSHLASEQVSRMSLATVISVLLTVAGGDIGLDRARWLQVRSFSRSSGRRGRGLWRGGGDLKWWMGSGIAMSNPLTPAATTTRPCNNVCGRVTWFWLPEVWDQRCTTARCTVYFPMNAAL